MAHKDGDQALVVITALRDMRTSISAQVSKPLGTPMYRIQTPRYSLHPSNSTPIQLLQLKSSPGTVPPYLERKYLPKLINLPGTLPNLCQELSGDLKPAQAKAYSQAFDRHDLLFDQLLSHHANEMETRNKRIAGLEASERNLNAALNLTRSPDGTPIDYAGEKASAVLKAVKAVRVSMATAHNSELEVLRAHP